MIDSAPDADTQQCRCSAPRAGIVKWAPAAALASALGACAACCLLPFVFVSVGLAGAWISTLNALEPYKWAFVGVTILLLGYGFYAVYWKPAKTVCAAGAACKNCRSNRHAVAALWIGTVLLLGGIAFIYIEPLLINE